MADDYRPVLKKILEEHPEIESINVEYKKVERFSLGKEVSEVASSPAGIIEPAGYITPSGLRPIVNPQVSPELIAKLRGQTTVETVNILNAPPEK